jgi:hypothetical protein
MRSVTLSVCILVGGSAAFADRAYEACVKACQAKSWVKTCAAKCKGGKDAAAQGKKLGDKALEGELKGGAWSSKEPKPEGEWLKPIGEHPPLPPPVISPSMGAKRKRWGCDDVRCNVYQNPQANPPNNNCPQRVVGSSRGHSSFSAACLAADTDANNQVPLGCVKRHCNCNSKCWQR